MTRTRRTRSRAHLTALALLATIALAAEAVVVAASPASAAASITADDFSRTATAGWGKTPQGQEYTASPASAATVKSGVGRFTLKSGTAATATLKTVARADATISATIGVQTATSSGNGVTFQLALRSGSGYQYQARARFATGGRLVLWISRYDGSTAKETMITPGTIALRNLSSESRVRLEFTATGTTSVQLQARASVVGTTASAWQAKGTDTSAARISSAGAVQVGTYLSASSATTVAYVDDLTVDPATATSTPTPTPTTPPSESSAGSLPVGSANYPVPSGAIFVRAGATGGDGSQAKPYGSLGAAFSKAIDGSTIVLRAGTYHESVLLSKRSNVTIQSYPKEAVWFDGSSRVTGWTKSGDAWVVDGWTYDFDSRVSFSRGVDESRRFLDPAYPMAGHPDQVWINGSPLAQVGSRSALSAGKFFVDDSADRLYIGSDPSGKTVEASTLDHAIQVQAQGAVLRGFGVRRYANTLSSMGALTAEVPRITFENLVATQNATVGIYAWASGHRFRHLTVTDNGLMGLGANVATGLSLTDSVFSGNNREHFKWTPVSGGVKITKSEGVVISGNTFTDNVTAGLWFDDSSYDVKITNNIVRGNSTLGMLIEATDKVVIADNYVHDNGKGVVVFDAGDVDIWNNTLVGNTRTLEFMQDERRQINSSIAAKIPWVMRDVVVKNNVLSYGSGGCPVLTQDLTQRWSGNDFGITLDGNLYHRQSASSPGNFSCWANGSDGTRSFKTLDAFRAHTSADRNSAAREGAAVTDAAFAVTSSAAKAPGLSPRGLPAAIASLVGVATNTARIGAISPY